MQVKTATNSVKILTPSQSLLLPQKWFQYSAYGRYIHHNKITHNNVCKYKRAQWWEIRLQPERGDIVDSMAKFCISVGYQGQLIAS
jgi:hypothetical protein